MAVVNIASRQRVELVRLFNGNECYVNNIYLKLRYIWDQHNRPFANTMKQIVARYQRRGLVDD